MTTETLKQWQTICHQSDLVKHSGVCALLANDEQIALFMIDENTVHTIHNWDPAGNANVLYRGIIGDDNGDIFVASPLYKQRFSLLSGNCLDDDALSVKLFETRIVDEQVQVLS